MLALAAASWQRRWLERGRGRRTVVERAVPRDVVCQRENRHQHGGQPARVSAKRTTRSARAARPISALPPWSTLRHQSSSRGNRIHLEWDSMGTGDQRRTACYPATIRYAPAKSIAASPGQCGITASFIPISPARVKRQCRHASVGQTDRWLTLPALRAWGTSRKRMDDQHGPNAAITARCRQGCHPTDAGGRRDLAAPAETSSNCQSNDASAAPQQRRGRCAQRARQRRLLR